MTENELRQMISKRISEIISICSESINIEYLAKMLDVSKPTIYAYSEGKRFPSAIFLHNLSKLTGVSADYMLCLSDLQVKT